MSKVECSRTGHGDIQLSRGKVWVKHCVPYFFILCVLQDKNTALVQSCNILQVHSRYKAKAISAKLWFSFSWPWFDLG